MDDALQHAGLARDKVYVTNAVKHFKWEERGKRRLHKKPRQVEITACRAWLSAEIAAVEPELIVCLGATAARALLGRDFRITQQRGQLLRNDGSPWIVATYHPAAVLRSPDKTARQRMRSTFFEDLRQAAAAVIPPDPT